MRVQSSTTGTPYAALKGRSGVYAILNTTSNRVYVGSAVDLYERYLTHLSKLRGGCHHNRYLQNAFRKHGVGAFVFQVLENVPCEDVLVREQHWMDLHPLKYNFCQVAGSWAGNKHSTETKSLIAQKMGGNQNAVGSKGRKTPLTATDVAKISASKRPSGFPVVVSPDGTEHNILPSLNGFCKAHGLTRQGVQKMLDGQRKTHRGWRRKT